MKEKISSRKLWVTISSMVIIIVTYAIFSDKITADSISNSIIKLAGIYVGSQGIVDAVTKIKEKIAK